MSTLVCFHAHPDDECISTAGVMSIAHERGDRVVLVVATRGERGEVPDGFLTEGEELWERRLRESAAAARVLGIDRLEFLGYVDSGMMGEPTNDGEYSFWTADVESAATRLAAILDEESADVLTVYDDHGLYGHPDHIQVHRVGVRAAELAGTPQVMAATMNRDVIIQARAEGRFPADEDGEADGDGNEAADTGNIDDLDSFGTPEADLTHGIDVTRFTGRKRAAMKEHRSQIADDSWFLTLDDDDFARAFGIEWFIEVGNPRGVDEPIRTAFDGR